MNDPHGIEFAELAINTDSSALNRTDSVRQSNEIPHNGESKDNQAASGSGFLLTVMEDGRVVFSGFNIATTTSKRIAWFLIHYLFTLSRRIETAVAISTGHMSPASIASGVTPPFGIAMRSRQLRTLIVNTIAIFKLVRSSYTQMT